ncbi:MAG TPA: hypothetical protein VF520_01985 [Thermoleophilaceae bacterium]
MGSISIDQRLPGAEIVAKGCDDLAAGVLSEEALLVAGAAPRLRSLGLEVAAVEVESPLHRLYELLAADSDDPHARYNALVRRVVSFARAAEHAASG